MDTSYLHSSVHPPEHEHRVPDWAHAAARQGARRALELLRSPQLPDHVFITAEADASAPFGGSENGVPCFAAHTRFDISISYPTALQHKFALEQPEDPERLFQVIAYCSAFETAVYALRSTTPDADEEIRYMAEYIASIASGFTLAPASVAERGGYYSIVRVFLRCLSSIRRNEGSAALWRGEIRRMIDELCQNVGFHSEPGQISATGERMRSDAIHPLIDYEEGAHPWPFGR